MLELALQINVKCCTPAKYASRPRSFNGPKALNWKAVVMPTVQVPQIQMSKSRIRYGMSVFSYEGCEPSESLIGCDGHGYCVLLISTCDDNAGS